MSKITILNEFQKFQYFKNSTLENLILKTEMNDKAKIQFDFFTFGFNYNGKKGKFYFHGTSIVFIFITENRKLNVMILHDDQFTILN